MPGHSGRLMVYFSQEGNGRDCTSVLWSVRHCTWAGSQTRRCNFLATDRPTLWYCFPHYEFLSQLNNNPLVLLSTNRGSDTCHRTKIEGSGWKKPGVFGRGTSVLFRTLADAVNVIFGILGCWNQMINGNKPYSLCLCTFTLLNFVRVPVQVQI